MITENNIKNKTDSLTVLMIILISAVPFCHYIFSGALLLLISVSLIVIRQTRREIMRQKRMVLLTAMISALSLIVSVVYGNTIGIFITSGVFLILLIGAYLRSVMNDKLLKLSSLIVAAGGIITSLIVIMQRIKFEDPNHRPYGLSYNPNYLGSVAVLAAVFSMVMLFDKNSDKVKSAVWEKVLYFVSFFADVVTILISESRSSLLALTASIIIFVFLKGHYIITAVSCVAGATVWIIGLINPDFFSWTNSLTEVFTGRLNIWKDAFSSFSGNFFTVMFGRGPMTYYMVRANEGLTVADHAHNILLDTLINVGITGLLIYMAIIFDIMKNAFDRRSRGDSTAFILITVAVCAVLVQGIPDVTIMWHQTATLFLLLCAAKKVND